MARRRRAPDNLPRARHWTDTAACRGVHPDVFFPDAENGESAWPAKRICSRCPVTDQCLEHALTKPERDGVWGGLDEEELTALRNAHERLLAAKQATDAAA